ncbi:MAG: hypothetical protein U0984_08140 [Prosthecobacter sp.]|nr:hypothetical protein [Prosthecobacter sp.]
MAKHSQHQQEASESKRSGGGQAVVELCSVSAGGLIFWSRQRFEIGAELQIRIRRDTLPCALQHCCDAKADAWITVSGFVVECPAVRRPDGAHEFRVSLLLESALTSCAPRRRKVHPQLRYVEARFPGMARLGLN